MFAIVLKFAFIESSFGVIVDEESEAVEEVVAGGAEVLGIVGFVNLGLGFEGVGDGAGPGGDEFEDVGFEGEGVVFDEDLLFLVEELGVDGDFLGTGVWLDAHSNNYLYFIYYDKNSNNIFLLHLNHFIYSIHTI